MAVAFDAGGNAYVLDRRRSRIVAFSRATGLPVRTIGSPGSGPGQLQNPSALTIDGGGTIVVADSGNERIARFSTGGSYLGATTGVGDGRGIAVTPDGQRTYLSTANHRIEVFDPSGSEVDEFGGQGSKLGKLESPGRSRSTPPATCGWPTAATTASRSSGRPASGCSPSASAAPPSASSCTPRA